MKLGDVDDDDDYACLRPIVIATSCKTSCQVVPNVNGYEGNIDNHDNITQCLWSKIKKCKIYRNYRKKN